MPRGLVCWFCCCDNSDRLIAGLGGMECELSELSEPEVAVDSQEEICEGSCVPRATENC